MLLVIICNKKLEARKLDIGDITSIEIYDDLTAVFGEITILRKSSPSPSPGFISLKNEGTTLFLNVAAS
jgi:hypothetical protein